MTRLFRNFSRLTLSKKKQNKKYNKIKIYTQCNLFSFWHELHAIVKLFSSNAFTSEKETSETTEVRDEVLESARASYKADQEKKWTAERERYQAEPERNRR